MMSNLEIARKFAIDHQKNLVNHIHEMLSDERPQPIGPLFGRRVCDDYADLFVERFNPEENES